MSKALVASSNNKYIYILLPPFLSKNYLTNRSQYVQSENQDYCIMEIQEFFVVVLSTYIYLSKYNKKYKIPHKTTQDGKYVQKGYKRTEQIGTNVKLKNIDITQHTPGQVIELVCGV